MDWRVAVNDELSYQTSFFIQEFTQKQGELVLDSNTDWWEQVYCFWYISIEALRPVPHGSF